jgi:hypothetical protein
MCARRRSTEEEEEVDGRARTIAARGCPEADLIRVTDGTRAKAAIHAKIETDVQHGGRARPT